MVCYEYKNVMSLWYCFEIECNVKFCDLNYYKVRFVKERGNYVWVVVW